MVMETDTGDDNAVLVRSCHRVDVCLCAVFSVIPLHPPPLRTPSRNRKPCKIPNRTRSGRDGEGTGNDYSNNDDDDSNAGDGWRWMKPVMVPVIMMIRVCQVFSFVTRRCLSLSGAGGARHRSIDCDSKSELIFGCGGTALL